MTETTTEPADRAETDAFDRKSMAGWQWFTRFLLVNVIAIAAGLAFVAIFTVWS
jgi:hypothetical protein